MTASLGATVRVLVRRTIDTYADSPQAVGWLRHNLDRFDEPLRVAIAGKVKAGKSTLLNALVGEEIAPTDAGECTRVVTWYHDGPYPQVTLYPRAAAPRPLPRSLKRSGARSNDDATLLEMCMTPLPSPDRKPIRAAFKRGTLTKRR